MASEILKTIASDIESVTSKIEEAQELIGALKEAGEDTSQLEIDLRSLLVRKTKWENMLRARGL